MNPDSPNNSDGGDSGGPAPTHAKLIIVNASPDAPPLRFCVGFGDPTDGGVNIPTQVAAPDNDTVSMANNLPFPGVWPGTGGPAADTKKSLSTAAVSLYAINAQTIAGQVHSTAMEATCDSLLGSDGTGSDAGLTPGLDYWYLGTTEKGKLADGTSWLIAVVGCHAGETGLLATACGTADGGTTLATEVWQLDNTTSIDGGAIGAQFAHASQVFDFLNAAKGGAVTAAGFYVTTVTIPDAGASDDAGDAGDAAVVEAGGPIVTTAFLPVAGDAKFGDLKQATLLPFPGVTFDGNSGFVANAVTADGGPVFLAAGIPLSVPVPLPTIEQLSWGANPPDAGAFRNGRGYVFVLVGDPTAPRYVSPADYATPLPQADGGVFNGRFSHILGFPTNPPFGQ
jgi:hypothetical protein